MKLDCGHDEEAGLVCAACAVDVQRELSVALKWLSEERERASALDERVSVLTEQYDEALVRLGVIRKMVAGLATSGSAMAAMLARGLRTSLEGERGTLEGLMAQGSEAGPEDEDQSAGPGDDEGGGEWRPRRRR